MSPLVPISWGELFDKITILEIKSDKLTSREALANVRHELASLAAIADKARHPGLGSLKAELRAVNEKLWQIEDDIRAKEAAKVFDDGFIALARAVYHSNDRRGAIKREINLLLNSELIEEKQYTAYE